MEDLTAIERLKQFIDYQKISVRKFFLECGLSEGSFTKTKSIGSENLKRIVYRYPIINMDWVISGRGKMLLSETLNGVIPDIKTKQDPLMVVGADIEPAQIAIDALKQQNKEMKEELEGLKTDLINCMKENKELIKVYQNQPVEKDPAN